MPKLRRPSGDDVVSVFRGFGFRVAVQLHSDAGIRAQQVDLQASLLVESKTDVTLDIVEPVQPARALGKGATPGHGQCQRHWLRRDSPPTVRLMAPDRGE